MAGDALVGRVALVTLAIPVKTPGDYRNTTTDVLEIGGSEDPKIPGNRIQFKIARSLEKEPNTSEVTVTNLSDHTRESIQLKGVRLTLEAGYVSTGMTRMFVGDVRTVDHVREGSDWNTVLRLGDGERSYRNARASESFAPGIGAGDILSYLASASGLNLGNVPTELLNLSATFSQGYVVSGLVQQSIDRLVKSLDGYTWSIQDNALQVLRKNGSLEANIPEDSPESGLIGSPEMGTPEKKGKPALVKYKRLLDPTRPGSRRKLISKRYNGFVRVKKCAFDGDTAGGPWYTTIEGTIDG